MRKLILSVLVVTSMALYSYQQRLIPSTSTKVPSPTVPAPAGTSGSIQNNQPLVGQSSGYKDGSYTGSLADAYYGYVQVLAIIKGGQITDVQFLRYPNQHRNSVMINQQAMPYLKEEALQSQAANVDIISGATDTSYAFRESLSSALAGAKI